MTASWWGPGDEQKWTQTGEGPQYCEYRLPCGYCEKLRVPCLMSVCTPHVDIVTCTTGSGLTVKNLVDWIATAYPGYYKRRKRK